MAIENHSDNLVYFNLGDKGYAIRSHELAGVAVDCPILVYPGLPQEVRGILHWNGKVFPIVAPAAVCSDDLRHLTYLIFEPDEGARVALAVSGGVRVFYPRSRASGRRAKAPESAVQFETRATLIDDSGVEATEVTYRGVNLPEVTKLAA